MVQMLMSLFWNAASRVPPALHKTADSRWDPIEPSELWASSLQRRRTQAQSCQSPKHPFPSHSTETFISHQTYETFWISPYPNQRDKKQVVSPDSAGVCVLQLCCVWCYGPQSNRSVLWAGGQQTLFCIPAAAAHLQTQQPITNKSRHSVMPWTKFTVRIALFIFRMYNNSSDRQTD